MILEHSSKNKKALVLIFIIFLGMGAFLYLYSPVIFQEGNPWPQIKGIVQLSIGNAGMVKLSDSDNKYMTKSKNGQEVIKNFMKDKGYEFTEQMGSGYLFRSPSGEDAVAVHKYYSRYYSLWNITENNNGSKIDNELWITTVTDQGITFQYPRELLAKYISEAEWPPVIKVETGPYACETTPLHVSSAAEITSQRLVDDRTYCVNVRHEGAAGCVYSSYTYTTIKNSKLVKIDFTLRYPNCNNYDEEQNRDCASEREAFDIDATVDRIAQTIK